MKRISRAPRVVCDPEGYRVVAGTARSMPTKSKDQAHEWRRNWRQYGALFRSGNGKS